MSAYDPYVPFSPPPGLLQEEALRRIPAGVASAGDWYRVTRFGGSEECRGTLDECVAFIEEAWWQALWATYDERTSAEHRAEVLRLERRDPVHDTWHVDDRLTDALRGLHMAS